MASSPSSFPFWLPPLNSHSNYDMSVMASQVDESRKDDQSLSGEEPIVHLKITASAILSSDDPWCETTLEGLHMVRSYTLLSSTIDSPSECKRSIRNILADMSIPLEFYELTWKHRHLNGQELRCIRGVRDVETMIEKVSKFLYEAKTQPHNKDFTFLPVTLTILKKITVPDHQYEAWNSWYEEMLCFDPYFEAKYEKAITRPRRDDNHYYRASEASDDLTIENSTAVVTVACRPGNVEAK